MANYFDNGLLAMEKSLRDVIAPALDPADPLAREQLALAIDYLGFLRDRVDLATQQLRFELDLYRDMAARVAEVAGRALPSDGLMAAIDAAEPLRSDVWAHPDRLRAAIARLAGAVDDSIAAADRSGNTEVRSAVDRTVHALSAHWIEFDSAWYGPIAVDPDALELKPLASFFPYRAPDAGAAT